jgi:hypothetical protein
MFIAPRYGAVEMGSNDAGRAGLFSVTLLITDVTLAEEW